MAVQRRPRRYSASRRGIRGRSGNGIPGLLNLPRTPNRLPDIGAPRDRFDGGEPPVYIQPYPNPGAPINPATGLPYTFEDMNPVFLDPSTGAGAGNGRMVTAPVLAPPTAGGGGTSGVVQVATADQGGAGAAPLPIPTEDGGGGVESTPLAPNGAVSPLATASPLSTPTPSAQEGAYTPPPLTAAPAPTPVGPMGPSGPTTVAPTAPTPAPPVGPTGPTVGAPAPVPAPAPTSYAAPAGSVGPVGPVAPAGVDQSSIPAQWRALFGLPPLPAGPMGPTGPVAGSAPVAPAAPAPSYPAPAGSVGPVGPAGPSYGPSTPGYVPPGYSIAPIEDSPEKGVYDAANPTTTPLISGGVLGAKIMDHGGVIDEPVFGKGLRSGREYLFAANGRPETVTPMRGAPLARSNKKAKS